MRLRKPLRSDPAAAVVGTFVLEEWLDRLPASYDVRPEWSTAAEHNRHRNSRAYMLWLGARREADRT